MADDMGKKGQHSQSDVEQHGGQQGEQSEKGQRTGQPGQVQPKKSGPMQNENEEEEDQNRDRQRRAS
jgi:hypothetical protein